LTVISHFNLENLLTGGLACFNLVSMDENGIGRTLLMWMCEKSGGEESMVIFDRIRDGEI